jgi:gluconate 2-dehydrogenase gamma chain
MADGHAGDFDRNLTAESFFHNLRRHTAEGFFSDPVYGGNRGLVGWKLVGFPGPQRAYTPQEFQREGTDRAPQSLMDLHRFNPGQAANADVILPVSGETEQHRP